MTIVRRSSDEFVTILWSSYDFSKIGPRAVVKFVVGRLTCAERRVSGSRAAAARLQVRASAHVAPYELAFRFGRMETMRSVNCRVAVSVLSPIPSAGVPEWNCRVSVAEQTQQPGRQLCEFRAYFGNSGRSSRANCRGRSTAWVQNEHSAPLTPQLRRQVLPSNADDITPDLMTDDSTSKSGSFCRLFGTRSPRDDPTVAAVAAARSHSGQRRLAGLLRPSVESNVVALLFSGLATAVAVLLAVSVYRLHDRVRVLELHCVTRPDQWTEHTGDKVSETYRVVQQIGILFSYALTSSHIEQFLNLCDKIFGIVLLRIFSWF